MQLKTWRTTSLKDRFAVLYYFISTPALTSRRIDAGELYREGRRVSRRLYKVASKEGGENCSSPRSESQRSRSAKGMQIEAMFLSRQKKVRLRDALLSDLRERRQERFRDEAAPCRVPRCQCPAVGARRVLVDHDDLGPRVVGISRRRRHLSHVLREL